MEITKERTCRPYAELYSVAEYLIDSYPQLMNDLKKSKEDLWDFFEKFHRKSLANIHVEKEDAVSNIR